MTSPRTEFKNTLSVGKVMRTVFEDDRSVTLKDLSPRGTTVNYETLRNLNVTFVEVVPQDEISKCYSSMATLCRTHACAPLRPL
jgi:hypothetical protein